MNAARRLETVRGAVDADIWAMLDLMLMRSASRRSVARMFDVSLNDVAALTHTALVELAQAYDLRVANLRGIGVFLA